MFVWGCNVKKSLPSKRLSHLHYAWLAGCSPGIRRPKLGQRLGCTASRGGTGGGAGGRGGGAWWRWLDKKIGANHTNLRFQSIVLWEIFVGGEDCGEIWLIYWKLHWKSPEWVSIKGSRKLVMNLMNFFYYGPMALIRNSNVCKNVILLTSVISSDLFNSFYISLTNISIFHVCKCLHPRVWGSCQT